MKYADLLMLLSVALLLAACGGGQTQDPTREPAQPALPTSAVEPASAEETTPTEVQQSAGIEKTSAHTVLATADHQILTAFSDDGNIQLTFIAPAVLQPIGDTGHEFATADGSVSLKVDFYAAGTAESDAIADSSNGAGEIQDTALGALSAVEGDTQTVVYLPGSTDDTAYVLVVTIDSMVSMDDTLTNAVLPILLSAGSGPAPSLAIVRMLAPELEAPPPAPLSRLDPSPFLEGVAKLSAERSAELDALVIEATVPALQSAFEAEMLSAEELVAYYVSRIKKYSDNGLNAVIELNSEALDIARALDAERAAGTVRGPLHGIPVLLKDNIATGDGMHAAAGAWAMREWQPQRDAFLAQQLRNAGAVILGKANLSEWANYMDPDLPNGYSALGGKTQNPYGPFETWGSSSGSAVAASANLAAVTVGTETQGSIIMPAGINGVVALKTSRGLVSRDHIIPLVDWMDVPGPMGRTVTDVAVLLSAMTGVDENDPATQDAAAAAGTDYRQFLSTEAADGMRLGIVVFDEADMAEINDQARQAAQPFAELGMELVDVPASAIPDPPPVNTVIGYAFRDALNRFLNGLDDEAPVASLAEIIALNSEDLANRAAYGQRLLEEAENSPLTSDEYAAKVEEYMAVAEELGAVFEEYELDALLDTSQIYAAAGFPALTVPAGYEANGQPKDIVLIGDFLSEPKLLTVGYAYEQATLARRAPDVAARVTALGAVTEDDEQ